MLKYLACQVKGVFVKKRGLPQKGYQKEVSRIAGVDKNGPIRGVLFDFDGTLTVPGAIHFDAVKRELGCPLNHPILEYIEEQPIRRRPPLKKILETFEETAARESVPNRGVKTCLSNLGRMEIPFGILTRNSFQSIKTALLNFQLLSITDFAVVITRDNSLPKPHPDGVFKAADAIGFEPGELLVVGDFRFDVIAGKRAGATTVYLTNGRSSTMERGDPEPDFVCRYLLEIVDILS